MQRGKGKNRVAELDESPGNPNPFTELVTSFRELKDAPGFWITNYIYWLDGVAYFGMLTLLAMYFHAILGISDDVGAFLFPAAKPPPVLTGQAHGYEHHLSR